MRICSREKRRAAQPRLTHKMEERSVAFLLLAAKVHDTHRAECLYTCIRGDYDCSIAGVQFNMWMFILGDRFIFVLLSLVLLIAPFA